MAQKPDIHALGEERISKLLLKFSIPCVMGLLISAFFRGVKKWVLAIWGKCGNIRYLFLKG